MAGAQDRLDQRNQLLDIIQNTPVVEDKTVRDVGSTTQFQQTKFDPVSDFENQLMLESRANFRKQQELATQQEQDIAKRAALQEQGRGVLGDIASGTAFDLSAGEQGRINAMRDASVDAGQSRINEFLNERLGTLQADAARRGLRGQAVSQLQGDVLGTAARELTQQQLAANQVAAQQAINMPAQRVGIQAGVGQGLADFQTQLQQQAIQNRQQLQDPVALQLQRDERLRGGRTETSADTFNKQYTDSTTTGVGVPQAAAALGTQAGAAETGIGTVLGGAGAIANFIPGGKK
jgi:hypothetical protein